MIENRIFKLQIHIQLSLPGWWNCVTPEVMSYYRKRWCIDKMLKKNVLDSVTFWWTITENALNELKELLKNL